MAKQRHTDADGDVPRVESAETETLSERMRNLILVATVEERRTGEDGEGSADTGERRRRGDQTSQPEERAS